MWVSGYDFQRIRSHHEGTLVLTWSREGRQAGRQVGPPPCQEPLPGVASGRPSLSWAGSPSQEPHAAARPSLQEAQSPGPHCRPPDRQSAAPGPCTQSCRGAHQEEWRGGGHRGTCGTGASPPLCYRTPTPVGFCLCHT